MAFQKEKVIQAYIQALNEVVDLVQKADVKAQAYKAKFITSALDLSGTNITQGQINAVNIFINDLNVLANGTVATTIKLKDQPSHGTKSLG